jgi:hypothetical protein
MDVNICCSVLDFVLIIPWIEKSKLMFSESPVGFYAYTSTYTEKNLGGFMNFEHVCISQKPPFEWGDVMIPHSVDAVQLTQAVANYFIR